MKNVRVLDCTLRDGGRIIDCAFPDSEIRDISNKLSNAKIDIIEVGFLRDRRKVKYEGNSTFFTDVDQVRPFVNHEGSNALYVAFIDYGMCDIDTLKPYDGTSIDGIRFGFTKKDYDENKEDVCRWINIIKERGYKLFVQGVNSLNYSDRELLEVVDMINEVHPYSFGIVDTYGAMYMDDIDRLYSLVDNNMLPDICINFHSHNNYQLSFALAQEVIRLSSTGIRQIIIDGTLGGMGKVAGNLNTELIVDYLVRRKYYDYELDDILDMFDDYIYKYSMKHEWGYSISAMMAGIYKSHPNNVIYLMERFQLGSKDIGKLLSMIDPETRQRYDYDNIERLYIEYASNKIDDHDSLNQLKALIAGKKIVVLVPGSSLNEYREVIDSYIHDNDAFVISVNFVSHFPGAFAFFRNQKKYSLSAKKRSGKNVIISSNIKSDGCEQTSIVVNYYSLINHGYKYFENSTIMLLNLLKHIEVKEIAVAGFDGFETAKKDNYYDSSFENGRHIAEFDAVNSEIESMLKKFAATVKEKCKISFITPSRFENCLK